MLLTPPQVFPGDRLVFIGDTGGNANVLADCLARAGVRDARVPEVPNSWPGTATLSPSWTP